jgi:hypothetical protein
MTVMVPLAELDGQRAVPRGEPLLHCRHRSDGRAAPLRIRAGREGQGRSLQRSTVPEVAELQGVSVRAVERGRSFAGAWLCSEPGRSAP